MSILFWFLIGASLLGRFYAMARAQLVPEEAYYWMYARHPNLSYFDHPPMVAWCIALGTRIFGNNEFGVRIVSNLLALGACGLIYRLGREWFGRASGIIAALTLYVLPIYFGIGFIATMDAALLFFWLVCLNGVTSAVKRGHAFGWYIAGVGAGGALLSKYTGVFLGVGIVLILVLRRPWRKHLLTPHPYAAALIAAALFAPVLLWNQKHDWASFRFQFLSRFEDDGFHVGNIGLFVWFQLVVLTPTLFLGAFATVWWLIRSRRRLLTARWTFAICFSVPLLLVMFYKSLRYEIHLNWTAPAFLSLIAPMAALFLGWLRLTRNARPQWNWLWGVRWTAILCGVANLLLIVYLGFFVSRMNWPTSFGPWRELAGIVQSHELQLEQDTGREPFIIASGKYRLASVLAFYRLPMEPDASSSDNTTSQWLLGGTGLGYPYWSDRADWIGRDCIYLSEGNEPFPASDQFDSVHAVADPRLAKFPRYHVTICRGLKRASVPAEKIDVPR